MMKPDYTLALQFAPRGIPMLLVTGALALMSYLIFVRAWVSEDAYITFRVIDNFMNGYGLRWNVHERVQAYTHPLWMLLHIPIYAAWGNLFHSSIALSILCTCAALMVTLFTMQRRALITLCCFLLPLLFSKSFMDYTSSGLENPLSFLLFAVFGYVVLNKRHHPHFWFYCSLTVSLAMFNRLDSIVIYALPLLYLVRNGTDKVNWYQVILGALPLIAWFAFALFYYGFIFPNTKYAKLNTELDLLLYIRQGLRYAKFLLVMDTPGAVLLLSSMLFLVFPTWFRQPPTMPRLPIFMALGIYSYSLYVVYIGGDYMAGRFWAFPIFASAWLWYMFAPDRLRLDIAFLIVCLLFTASRLPPLFESIRASCRECITLQGRVLDAIHIFHRNRLIVKRWPLKIRYQGRYHFANGGKKLAEEARPPVKSMWYIGMVGYYAGPKVTIIDELGLADPLLARLPAAKRQSFYIGHFRRNIPFGYRHALESGKLNQMPPALARYYGKLRLIISGDLLDPNRLQAIVLFNLGAYDHWKDKYLTKPKAEPHPPRHQQPSRPKRAPKA